MSALKSAVFGIAGLALGALFASANAQDARLVGGDKTVAPASELTIGAMTPAYGMVTLPLSATDPVSYGLAGTSTLIQDFAARYSTSIYGGEFGVFARYADRPLMWAPETSSAFNFGASVGYAGFYLQGAFTGVNDNVLMHNFQSWQSWQAGFGYGIGAFDVRLTYSMGEGSGAFSNNRNIDNNQWMLGGIYQLSPGIRFNADAFLGGRFSSPGLASAQPGTSTPQGTGARVGVQLRF
ncbi:MAG: porin [Rhodospirillaceae bacterium]|nr:porin [Rhodospirillaceae bacterium]